MTAGEARPSLLYLIKQLELVVRSRLGELVKPAGITPPQYTALTALQRHDGLTTARLARDSLVTAQAMADIVGALESRGLVRRQRNAGNRRDVLIHLTDAGAGLLAELAGPVADLERRLAAGLGPDRANGFRQSLVTAWQVLS